MKSTVKTRTSSRKPGDVPQPIGIKYSIIALLFLLGFIQLLKRSESLTLRELRKAQAPTLVTYIFSDTDPEYAENLRFFIREGITALDDECDYKIVVQVSDTEEELSPELVQDLEDLKSYSNVEILEHKNECYDIGTIGWVYSLLGSRISKYSYFIWLNSSVRGPFLPSYLERTYHWTRAFTGKLNDKTKLVGSTISCGMTGDHPPALHIQTYAVATDTVGLELLQRNDTIFKCYDTLEDVVFFSERGVSETILNAGYSIDCLMSRYQGIDWQAARHMVDSYGCNGDLNPLQPGFYDGTDVDPMEVMFIKVKRAFLKAQWPSATKAEKLSLWKMETMISNETEQIMLSSANDWLDIRVGKLEQDARKRGMSCFDWEFYLDANKQDPLIDQDEENKEEAAWEQFLEMGIFEGRPYRWRDSCIS